MNKNLFDLTGRKVAVTGSSGLLGKQFCSALSDYGAEVIGLDILTGFDILTDTLPDCDVLVNNARIVSSDWAEIMRVNIEGIERTSTQMRPNTVIINISSIYGVVAPDQRIYGGTEIANSPASYSASKAAVIGLTQHHASAFAHMGIRVNCISPGGIATNHSEEFRRNYSARVPMGRMANPDDINGALIFLASDASRYVNGQNIIVDGGLTAW